MIVVGTGSIFDSTAQILVCPVNAVGAMGAGLARAFARQIPDLEVRYKGACRDGMLRPGTCYFAGIPGPPWIVGEPHEVVVACLATKDHWREPSRMTLVLGGLASLMFGIEQLDPPPEVSVAIPALGCGLGGLAWSDVRPLIVAACSARPERRYELYGPGPGGGG